MGLPYIYEGNAQRYDTTGLVGALLAVSCEHEEIGGGMSSVTMQHPMDPWGKWRAIQRGRILKCDVRVRTVPEIEQGQVVTSVERWTVKATATKTQRGVFSKPVKGSRKATLDQGTTVTVTQKGESRYKIRTGKTIGWIAQEALDFEVAQTLPASTDAIEQVAPPWEVRPQLFRILEVSRDTKKMLVTAYAVHISYDLTYNVTRYRCDEPLTAQQALDGIKGGLAWASQVELYTDSADLRTSCDWTNVNAIEALLEPETGFAARWGLELVRDDESMYFLHRAGRNRGSRIEYGKNLLGVNYDTSDEQVVTAILPIGTQRDGADLYLTDDPNSPDNWVLSKYVDDYPVRHSHVLRCSDATVEKGKKGVTLEVARERLREQAQRMYDEDECDLPAVNMTVDFVHLGDTLEYQQFKSLDLVYLWDSVPVVDAEHGVEVMADVHRIKWDCLRERMLEIEMGNVREGVASIYSWMVQYLDGSKVVHGTLPGEALEDGTIPETKLDPDLQEALNKAKEDIASALDLLADARERLALAEDAVRDNEGNISLLQQDATEIWAGLTNAQEDLAAVSLRADQLQTALTNAQGDVSTLIQRADSMSGTISALSGEISSVRQTASSLSSLVSTLNGQVASLIQQTAQAVSVKLRDDSVSAAYELRIASGMPYTYYMNPSFSYGQSFSYNGAFYGGMFISGASSNYFALETISRGYLRNHGVDWVMLSMADMVHGGMATFELTSSYNVGKRIRASEAVTVDSDRRLKGDIAPIVQGEALFDRLRPRQYRVRGSTALSFGFVAQEVDEALRALDMPETVLLSAPEDEDKGYYGLNYQELIALCVEKIQRQQRQIDDLMARVARLEGKP